MVLDAEEMQKQLEEMDMLTVRQKQLAQQTKLQLEILREQVAEQEGEEMQIERRRALKLDFLKTKELDFSWRQVSQDPQIEFD